MVRAAPLALPLFLLACAAPVGPGLACPDGFCPDGQVCGPGNVCTFLDERGEGCVPACGAGFNCGTDGQCHRDFEGEDRPAIDGRGSIGAVVGMAGDDMRKCLATVIAPTAVVTTARCAYDVTNPIYRTPSGDFAVASVSVHPSFNPLEHDSDGDVALLHLELPTAQLALDVATMEPTDAGESTAVVPASATPSDLSRLQVAVSISEVTSSTYEIASDLMRTPFACPISGGPTVVPDGPSEAILGLHSDSACAGRAFRDIRLTPFASWIEDEIAGAGPETCDGFVAQQCEDCGQTKCTETGSGVLVTCERNEATYPCDAGETCNAQLVCEADDPPMQTECEWMNGYNSRPCSECGHEWCLSNGTWSGTCGNVGGCGSGNECVDTGPSGGYDSTWVCQAESASAQCSIAGYDSTCPEDPGSPPPSPAIEGDYWTTASNCPTGSCRLCDCLSGGSLSCTACFAF